MISSASILCDLADFVTKINLSDISSLKSLEYWLLCRPTVQTVSMLSFYHLDARPSNHPLFDRLYGPFGKPPSVRVVHIDLALQNN